MGDADGVVVVPPSLIDRVNEICEERAEVDDKMFKALRSGEAMGHLIKTVRKNK